MNPDRLAAMGASMDLLTIRQLRQAASGAPCAAELHAQLERIQVKPSKNGSEFLELKLSDSADHLMMRVWGDSPAFAPTRELPPGSCVSVEAEWTTGSFGLEPRQWKIRPLEDLETETLLAGSAAIRRRQEEDYQSILETTGTLLDPRLRSLCRMFLEEYGERFRRTGAAREYHHARRGGLVEHVAQMMRSASALAAVYPDTHRDLLLAGVLFHDCGKLWENCYDRSGFHMPFTDTGELLGHIPIGIELVNQLWRRMMAAGEPGWAAASPPAEQVRLHLLHLIASHHGEYQFGSPVLPRTPEAVLLHHVDNMDAKLEMYQEAYACAPLIAPNIHERHRPLPGHPVRPLAKFSLDPDPAPSADSGDTPETACPPESV